MTEIGPSEGNIRPLEGTPKEPSEVAPTQGKAPVPGGLSAIADQLLPESALLDAEYLTQVFDAALPQMPKPQLADDPAVRKQQETSSLMDVLNSEFSSELEGVYDELIGKYVKKDKHEALKAAMKWDKTSGEEKPEALQKLSEEESENIEQLGGYLKVIGTLLMLARRIINKSQELNADDMLANIADRKAAISQIREMSKQLVKEMEKIKKALDKAKMWGKIMQYVSLGTTAVSLVISAIILVAAVAAFCFSSGTLTVVCIAAISFAITLACSSVTITDLIMAGAISQKATETVQDFVSSAITWVSKTTGLDETAAKVLVYVVIAAVIMMMIAAIILVAVATKGSGAAQAGSKAAGTAAEQAAKQAAKKAAEEAAKQATKQVAKEATEEVAEQVVKQAAKEAAEEVAQQAAKAAAKEVVEETTKQAASKTGQITGKEMLRSTALLSSTQVMNLTLSMTNILHQSIAEIAKAAGVDEEDAEWIATIASAIALLLLTVGGTQGAASTAGLIGRKGSSGAKAMATTSKVMTGISMASTAAKIPIQIQQGLIQMNLAEMVEKKGDLEAELAFIREFVMKLFDFESEAINQTRESLLEISEALIKTWTGMVQKYSTTLSQLYGA